MPSSAPALRRTHGLWAPALGWAPGPNQPELEAGAVHVWRGDLDTVSAELGLLLSAAERARAEAIVDERRRARWLCSRGLLRVLLGRYLAADPGALRLGEGEHGKPHLLPAPGSTKPGERGPSARTGTVEFNLAHSGARALYAFSASAAVGIDVEAPRAAMNVLAIARRVLGAAEAERIEALAPDLRQPEFLQCWARHEAVLKCRGSGIAAAERTGGRPTWVIDLELGVSAAALAAARPPASVRLWEWTALQAP